MYFSTVGGVTYREIMTLHIITTVGGVTDREIMTQHIITTVGGVKAVYWRLAVKECEWRANVPAWRHVMASCHCNTAREAETEIKKITLVSNTTNRSFSDLNNRSQQLEKLCLKEICSHLNVTYWYKIHHLFHQKSL